MTTVNCSFIKAEPELLTSNFVLGNGISVFYADLSEFTPRVEQFRNFLREEEVQKSYAFQRESDRDSFIIRRSILRLLLGNFLNCSASSIEFRLGENKRPEISFPQGSPLVFSSSHSAEKIVIAIGQSLLGIDIEKINTAFGFEDIAGQFFSKSENEYILSTPEPSRTFFTLWTRKEALLKANSFGIDDNLDLVPSLDGVHLCSLPGLTKASIWQVKSFYPESEYIVSIASSVEAKIQLIKLAIKDFDLK